MESPQQQGWLQWALQQQQQQQQSLLRLLLPCMQREDIFLL